MKLFKYLMGVAIVLTLAACETTEDEKKVYPEITTLEETMWYSYDAKKNVYYDIYYNANSEGVMIGYDTSERENEVSRRLFDYGYTRATEDVDAIVDVMFDDGGRYGGILIPKGNLQISNKEVYIIQLYELSADGSEILYDENGNIKSTLMMWKE